MAPPIGARALSTATVSFGLVSIPVDLFTTSESDGQLHFNMLHECGSWLKQQYVCPKCERVTPREEVINGYEFAKGQFVTFTPAELKGLEEEGSRQIIDLMEALKASLGEGGDADRSGRKGPKRAAKAAGVAATKRTRAQSSKP